MPELEKRIREKLRGDLLRKFLIEWQNRYKNITQSDIQPIDHFRRNASALSKVFHKGISEICKQRQPDWEVMSQDTIYKLLSFPDNHHSFKNAHTKTLNSASIYLGYASWEDYFIA